MGLLDAACPCPWVSQALPNEQWYRPLTHQQLLHRLLQAAVDCDGNGDVSTDEFNRWFLT